jgi:hypothetical protein
MAFKHTKKVYTEPFIKARIRIRSQTSGSGSYQKGPDPTGSGSGSTTLNLRAECQRPEPPAEFVLGLRAGVGNPRNIGKLIAKEIVLWWQSAELERGAGVSNGVESSPRHFTSRGPLFEMFDTLSRDTIPFRFLPFFLYIS